MHLQQQQAGHRKHQRREREHIDEQAPGRAGIAPLVQIVEVREPAAIGQFVRDRAAFWERNIAVAVAGER